MNRRSFIQAAGLLVVSFTQGGTVMAMQQSQKNTFAGKKLYAGHKTKVKIWLEENPRDTKAKVIAAKIASQPTAIWCEEDLDVDELEKNIQASVASTTIPVFVAYNIPDRDYGGYSAGGADSSRLYKIWIRALAHSIGTNPAILILEPDALGHARDDDEERYKLLVDAVNVLVGKPAEKRQTRVYIDAGHSRWHQPQELVKRLIRAGIKTAHGFSVNTSNFISTLESTAYVEKVRAELIAQKIGPKDAIIDTSRNGNGPLDPDSDKEWWCNPPGRKLGKQPSLITDKPYIVHLWVKPPGESDGECRGGPKAGVFWPEYAFELVQ
jgi:endoglucanase